MAYVRHCFARSKEQNRNPARAVLDSTYMDQLTDLNQKLMQFKRLLVIVTDYFLKPCSQDMRLIESRASSSFETKRETGVPPFFKNGLLQSVILPVVLFVLALLLMPEALAANLDSRGAGSGFVPQPLKPVYKLTEAVDTAMRNYPSLRRVNAQVGSKDAGVYLAKTAYLPTLNVIAQEMRTTQNVIAGTIFPQVLDAIPIQSGTPTHSSTFKSVWNSNQAANLSWELWDFGLRKSNVLRARAQKGEATSQVRLTELDVAANAAEAYLKTVATYEVIRARQATLKKMEAWQLVVRTLVDNGLRPGVDTSRVDANVASARIGLIEAQRDHDLARVDLSEAMGVAGSQIGILTKPYSVQPRQSYAPLQADLRSHPLALLRASGVQTERAKLHVLERSYYPHIYYHSAMWGRGSGNKEDPRRVAGGILPQTGNWTVGMSLSFPMMSYFEIDAKRKMQSRVEDESRAYYDLAMQELIKGDERAKILLENAKKIANETPLLVQAARDTEMRALERYKVGLTDVVEVAQAEDALARAEVENAVADVKVWRSILAVSYAQGNLRPLLQLARLAEENPP